ncbi:MAG TPA: DUF1501 domain-containing protein [Frateuria sp.]|uniref:DUF1501 domain-containing protein n=1 Tax=Frateuria sp. TaxID=2211372 RepID=UPI002DE5CB9B|nr:DUF1501 domain-containing protein [Frateuria sp.]
MDRRQFLRSAATTLLCAPALGFSGRLFAAPADTPRFLLVFLRGGYDCNHLLVPYGSDFYYESRPNLAIARPDGARPDAAVALDAQWALGPAARDALLPYWQRKQLAFVPFAGTADLSRSHFETQDDIESGQAGGMHGHDRSGFLARLSGLLTGVPPIAFTRSLPLSLQGGGPVPNIALGGGGHARFDARQASILAGMYEDTALAPAAHEGLALQQEVAQDRQEEMLAASRGAPGAASFVTQARRMAALMLGKYRLGFVDVGGWDTHVNQGAATGRLATSLTNLSAGLAAFGEALGAEWNNTVVVVISEFGRTFRENGDKGTDHGHGTAYWLMGGRVAGGRVAGEQVAVTAGNLLQNRDYPVLNNYRDVLGGVFRRLWGLSAGQVEHVFPGARPNDLGLV